MMKGIIKDLIGQQRAMESKDGTCSICPFNLHCDVCLYLFPEIGLFDWIGWTFWDEEWEEYETFSDEDDFYGGQNIPCPCWFFDEDTILKIISEIVD